MSGELCRYQDGSTSEVSRREFLMLGLSSVAILLEASALSKILLRPDRAGAAILPPELDEQITKINVLLRGLGKKIYLEEAGKVPELNSDGIGIIYLAKNNFNFLQPLGNPDDLSVWLTGTEPFKYNFRAERPDITGGIAKFHDQGREIFNAYLAKDQYRVAGVMLTSRNSTSSYKNTVEWEAGALNENHLQTQIPWDFYRTFIHELTHAGNPLNGTKLVDGKFILLPYGLRRTLDFVSVWLEAMNQEYEYFQRNFFRADGDEVLNMIRRGGILKFSNALQEIVAISCTNYILPPYDNELAKIVAEKYEPLETYPLTEKAIRKTIAYVHDGVTANDFYPDGIAKRNRFTPGTPIGDLFWKIYTFWKK